MGEIDLFEPAIDPEIQRIESLAESFASDGARARLAGALLWSEGDVVIEIAGDDGAVWELRSDERDCTLIGGGIISEDWTQQHAAFRELARTAFKKQNADCSQQPALNHQQPERQS